LRLGCQAGRRLAEVYAGHRLRMRTDCCGAVTPDSADSENRETMVAETRLGPCIKCR
jgi:hypothetical protein